jgi:hypothetical protein
LGSSRWTVLSFFFASLILSLSHAALAAVLAVAPALLGERLGSVACGTLFVAWVLSSLVAPYYMRILRTPRRALLTGLAGNVCYLGGMCAACYFYSGNSASSYMQWAFAIGAALVGGAGNGPLFVGQSCYFARAAAELDAQARRRSRSNPESLAAAAGGGSGDRGHGSAGSSTPESRALLSALFATTFFALEPCRTLPPHHCRDLASHEALADAVGAGWHGAVALGERGGLRKRCACRQQQGNPRAPPENCRAHRSADHISL